MGSRVGEFEGSGGTVGPGVVVVGLVVGCVHVLYDMERCKKGKDTLVLARREL